jgi:hypothetical protein
MPPMKRTVALPVSSTCRRQFLLVDPAARLLLGSQHLRESLRTAIDSMQMWFVRSRNGAATSHDDALSSIAMSMVA